MLSLCITAALYGEAITPIETISWMSGNWSCEIWGGVFEERWSPAAGGTMQGTGRLISDGKTPFMEFMSIEPDKDGQLIMWIVPGRISKPNIASTPFKLTRGSKTISVWENPENDFPSKITYTKKSASEMHCVIEGHKDGKKTEEIFEFKEQK